MKGFRLRKDGLEEMMADREIDAKLESEGQLMVRQMLKAMPEDPVNLAWRSDLNQKLMAKVEARQRKRRVAWFLSPALGLGLAGALAIVLMTNTPNVVPMSGNRHSNLEATLVADHRNNLRYTDVTGVGLNPEEVVDGKSINEIRTDYGEVDLGSL